MPAVGDFYASTDARDIPVQQGGRNARGGWNQRREVLDVRVVGFAAWVQLRKYSLHPSARGDRVAGIVELHPHGKANGRTVVSRARRISDRQPHQPGQTFTREYFIRPTSGTTWVACDTRTGIPYGYRPC